MKYLAALSFAGLAAAQLGSLPTCAQSCASKFLAGGIGNCGTDPKCICSDSDFISGIACCLAEPGGCDTADQSSAITYASQICAAQGVTVPSAVVCTSSFASSGTAASAATATASSGTVAATASTVASTSAATATAAATKAATTAATTATTGSKTSASSTKAATASTASAATAASSANWAPQQSAALGGVIGGLAAALALL